MRPDQEAEKARARSALAAHVQAVGYPLAAELIRRHDDALVFVPSELPLELGNLPSATPADAAAAIERGHALVIVANGARA